MVFLGGQFKCARAGSDPTSAENTGHVSKCHLVPKISSLEFAARKSGVREPEGGFDNL